MQVSLELPSNGFVCENRFDYSFASSLLVLLHVSLRTARGENSRHKLCARLQILPLSAQSRLVFVQKGWFILHLKGWIIVINIFFKRSVVSSSGISGSRMLLGVDSGGRSGQLEGNPSSARLMEVRVDASLLYLVLPRCLVSQSQSAASSPTSQRLRERHSE